MYNLQLLRIQTITKSREKADRIPACCWQILRIAKAYAKLKIIDNLTRNEGLYKPLPST